MPPQSKLPGYPARPSPRASGSYLVSLFAPRNRLTEFALLEGYFETMPIAENFYSGLLAAGLEKSNVISFGEMRALAADWSKRLNVKGSTIMLAWWNFPAVISRKW